MKSTLYKLGTAVTSSALLLASAGNFAMAGQTIRISGNGTGSDNAATTSTVNTTFVTQTNDARINNNVDVDANTGRNDANGNTGGDVTVRSGNSDVDVAVNNMANQNMAKVQNCGGCPGDLKVVIEGNGSHSNNTADVTRAKTVVLTQDNRADINNDVNVNSDTGGNRANDNTGAVLGSSDPEVRSGNSSVNVRLGTAVNHNVASIGSGSGSGNGGDVTVAIRGNGTRSTNDVNLDLLSTVFLDQTNGADVSNHVNANADTGNNQANDNTGDGDVLVMSGDSDVNVDVKTMANFNAASIDECCPKGLDAEISGNGSRSDSSIDTLLDSFLVAGQFNNANVDNGVDATPRTGDNRANDNTGSGVTDRSGHANTDVRLSTMANHNVFGDADMDWPDMNFEGGSHSLIMKLVGLMMR